MENQQQVPVTDNDSDAVVVDINDTEALKKNFETLSAQKRHWREKAKKESEEKATLQKELDIFKAPKADSDPTKLSQAKPSDFDSLADNLAVLRNLQDDEVAELRATAKELGTDPIQFIKSKAGQAQLKVYRSEQKSKEASPAPSNRIPVYNGKPVNAVLTDPNASAADKQAAFEARFRRAGANSSQ